MPAYKAAGLPVFGTESSGSDFDITDGGPNYGLTPADWQAKLDSGGAIVVDVRTPGETAGGMLPGAININSADIGANPSIITEVLEAEGIEKNQLILIHCAAGARAAGVPQHFVAQGYENIFYLANPIFINADGSYAFFR
ncbi:rhodanese-like domain-containing protein [Desulfuribacillus alkaliarsenatis]|uniref:Rhodanese domain-containing protein n=1 Tax=Desulfuribacillus alkaliarsenatis TaxID=766136 RepID=A0A1E5G0V1_9FIRM|nr:rhodanese-like domain-containing protein [Desulfuribacillus alkaliarsenatis]OEF96537.1 hypothetical protein BHF68_07750 [Desulfuribacillus alkaliarsenatis]